MVQCVNSRAVTVQKIHVSVCTPVLGSRFGTVSGQQQKQLNVEKN